MHSAGGVRESVQAYGVDLSFVRAGSGPPALLLHGTLWSRVWEPVLTAVGERAEAFALDLPGFGRSGGRLVREEADVPSLARVVRRFLDVVGIRGEYAVAGHDIGGAIAQHLVVHDHRAARLALLNSALYDSWPVPTVARFRDPEVLRTTTPDDLVRQRSEALSKLLAHEPSPGEREAWVEPWRDPDRAASWMALAAAADSRYTQSLVPALRHRGLPTHLIWGTDDEFQRLGYAERYACEIPGAILHRVSGARHVPMHDDPATTGPLLRDALAGSE